MSIESKENQPLQPSPGLIEFKKRFLHFKNDFSNEIPKEIIHGDKKENLFFKVRKNWFQRIVLWLGMLEKSNIIRDENILQRARNFIKEYTSTKFVKQERVAKEDIQKADELIDEIIKIL